MRGPKYVVRRGKTPVLSAEQARQLLNSIDASTLMGLRDRALIGLMLFSFARVGAANTLRLGDYFENEKRQWLRLHEKGGKRHEVPCHHDLVKCLNAWLPRCFAANRGRAEYLGPGTGRGQREVLCQSCRRPSGTRGSLHGSAGLTGRVKVPRWRKGEDSKWNKERTPHRLSSRAWCLRGLLAYSV